MWIPFVTNGKKVQVILLEPLKKKGKCRSRWQPTSSQYNGVLSTSSASVSRWVKYCVQLKVHNYPPTFFNLPNSLRTCYTARACSHHTGTGSTNIFTSCGQMACLQNIWQARSHGSCPVLEQLSSLYTQLFCVIDIRLVKSDMIFTQTGQEKRWYMIFTQTRDGKRETVLPLNFVWWTKLPWWTYCETWQYSCVGAQWGALCVCVCVLSLSLSLSLSLLNHYKGQLLLTGEATCSRQEGQLS